MSIKNMIRENSVLVGVQTSTAMMDASRQVPPKTKNRTTIWPSYTNYSWEYTQINLNQHATEVPAHPCLLRHYTPQSRDRINLGVP